MNSSVYVGRVGGLAVALGVGAAILGSSGTAWAGPDSPAPGPSATGSGTGGASDVGSAIRKAVKDSLSNVAAIGTRARGLGNDTRTSLHDLADNVSAHLTTTTTTTPQQRASGNNTFAVKPPAVTSLPSFGATRPRPRLTRAVEALSTGPIAQSLPEAVNLPDTLNTMTAPLRAASTATTTNGPAAVVATALNQILRPLAGNGPGVPPLGPAAGLVDLVQLAGLRRGLSGAAATLDQPSASAASPTLVLNGYDIVPTTRLAVTSFYGLFTTPPAGPGTIQGTQDFEVFDSHGAPAGTFTAFVSKTNSFLLGGGTYQELVVRTSEGDGAPPVGTLIASNSFAGGLFGTLYTSTPSASGNVVSYKLLTPFRDFNIPLDWDAAGVLTAVDEPLVLQAPTDTTPGYYIAPDPNSPETGMSVSGLIPLFSDYQGEQVFNVYKTDMDGNAEKIGSFKGYVTTTADVLGGHTEAILVTEVIDAPVGTDAGQVPGVGSVYNVFYGVSAIYSAVVPPGGGPAVTTFKLGTPVGFIPIPLNFDASVPPVFKPLSVPGKYSFVPMSTLTPIGVNGLPPREVQIQGYQTFDVFDSHGNKIGTVDADVTTQKNLTGTSIQSILVTKVTPIAGTDPASLPPVGSQFSAVYYPADGFGLLYTSIPGDKSTYSLVTPLGNVKVPALYDASKGLEDVTYV